MEEVAGIEAVIRAIRKTELKPDDALRIVSTLKGMGLIDVAAVKNTGRGAVPFIEFIESFWDYDKSEYIRDRIAHGYRFSRRHAYQAVSKLFSLRFSCDKRECFPWFSLIFNIFHSPFHGNLGF